MFRTANALATAVRDRPSVSELAPQWQRIALIVLLGGILGWLPLRGNAAGLECPEIDPPGTVSSLLTDVQVKLVASGNSVDLSNEIYDLINKLQNEKPNISYSDLTDILIAAYCPVVASLNLTAAEKWRRMRQFDTILRQQLATNMMPAGPLIIANVPLPPAVYHELRSQAASVGQTPAQLMTAILSRAAGK